MTSLTDTPTTPLYMILEELGFGIEPQDQNPLDNSYRLEFEKNFIIELQTQHGGECRISARIYNLGKSLQVQDNQIRTAMSVFSEVLDDMPQGSSPAISNHDNCLRLCLEMVGVDKQAVMQQFHEFVNVAFAFQQTCLQQG